MAGKNVNNAPSTVKKALEMIEAFADAFARYLPSTPFQSATPTQASNGAGCDALSNRHGGSGVTLSKPSQASNGAGCVGVAVSNPPKGENDDAEPL